MSFLGSSRRWDCGVSSEISKGDHTATDYQVLYDGMVKFARHAHSECMKVRESMLSQAKLRGIDISEDHNLDAGEDR